MINCEINNNIYILIEILFSIINNKLFLINKQIIYIYIYIYIYI